MSATTQQPGVFEWTLHGRTGRLKYLRYLPEEYHSNNAPQYGARLLDAHL